MDSKDKVINDLLSRIAKLEYEVEELQKENDLDCNLNKSLLKDIDKAGKEIERLNNIIKEVREYIEDDRLYMSNGDILSIANTGCGQKILEILDKEKDNE